MSSTRLIDNYDAFQRHDFERENRTVPASQLDELINDTTSDIHNVINGLNNTDDCTDLMELVDEAIDNLEALIGKLEGER